MNQVYDSAPLNCTELYANKTAISPDQAIKLPVLSLKASSQIAQEKDRIRFTNAFARSLLEFGFGIKILLWNFIVGTPRAFKGGDKAGNG